MNVIIGEEFFDFGKVRVFSRGCYGYICIFGFFCGRRNRGGGVSLLKKRKKERKDIGIFIVL